MRINILLFTFFVTTCQITFSQDDSWKVFDDSQVARVDITIAPAALAFIYQYPQSDSEHVTKVRFKNKYIDETKDSVGFRLRGATSRNARKKSFKVEYNSFVKGRKFYNITDLNLNGEHNDPSIVRSKLVYDLSRTIGLKSPRACHAEVYINGKYYGLYILIEQIDDEWLKKNYKNFNGNLWKCLYPADLRYLGMDPNAYKNVLNNGVPAYDLKTNTELGDFTKFVRLVNIVNNTSASVLADSLESVIDIQDLLKYLALHVVVGGWDNYWSLMNNYYLYHDPGADIFHILPYDEDNTLGIDWFSVNWATANIYNWPKVAGGARPLAEKILANAQYRNLYTHFIDHISKNAFYLPLWESHLDSIKALINPSAMMDSFRTLDYGFNSTHFHNSYSASFSYQHVKFGIKQFALTRYTSYPGQIQWLSSAPIVYNIRVEPANPGPADTIRIFASAFDNDGIAKASVLFTKTGSVSGEEYPLTFSPVTGTKKAEEADRYIAIIPPLGINGSGTFLIYVKDPAGASQLYPRKKPFAVKVNNPITNTVVVNELLADNSGLVPDPSGEFDDYVELYNPTTQLITLTGKYMTDNSSQLKKWRITQPQLVLQPGAHLIVWCDEQSAQQGVHAMFKLSKSGEFIAIVDTNGTTILDSVTFGPQSTNIAFGRIPDGGSTWGNMTPTPGVANTLATEKDGSFTNGFKLFNCYPNPFNPETKIIYNTHISGNISLRVYDVMGREVAILFDGWIVAGEHSAIFNGNALSSGVYYITLRTEGATRTIKSILLR
ncbi:MAG: CotH kinase family protein [Ignavibacteriales bacterium]|nr:CotH kinase family protein [Ignavibacteriales bacterium]